MSVEGVVLKPSEAGPQESKANGNAKPREVTPIPRAAIQLAELANNAWEVTVAGCESPEQALHADRWPNAGGLVRRFDVVRCRDAQGRWWAEMLCVESELGFVRMALLRSCQLPPLSPIGEGRCPPGWTIEPGGADRGGYIGVRIDPKTGRRSVVDRQGIPFARREDALRAVMDHSSNREPVQ